MEFLDELINYESICIKELHRFLPVVKNSRGFPEMPKGMKSMNSTFPSDSKSFLSEKEAISMWIYILLDIDIQFYTQKLETSNENDLIFEQNNEYIPNEYKSL